MATHTKLARLALLPLIAGSMVFGEAGSAHAATTSSSAVACLSSQAVTAVAYRVNGASVAKLQGNTRQGATVEVDFKLAAGCGDTMVSLAAYRAPSNTFDVNTMDKQVLTDHQSATFSADGQLHTLQVTLVNCDYQVDFTTGPVLNSLTATGNYSSPQLNLIASDNGGTKVCDVAPSAPVTPAPVTPAPTTTVPAPTTSTTTPAVEANTVGTADTVLPTEVLGEVITPDTGSAQLAQTGINTELLLGIGGALVLVGEFLSRTSLRLRKRA